MLSETVQRIVIQSIKTV